ncbi:MAG TPA: type I-C CRISPR-associated protein Cas8c/Csd1 [Kofleriaceae bacterium]|jgi:CRISPR-associated protein Csd1
MMLTALVAYADREGLGDLDFETRPVDYELRIDDDGTFVGLVPLGTDRGRAQLPRLPIGPPSKNNPGYPNFVVDNAQYLLATPKKDAKAGNTEKCFESYSKLIDDAGNESADAGLRALAKFMHRDDQRLAADGELKKLEAAKSNRQETVAKNVAARADRVLAPTLDSDGALRIHERAQVVDWWTIRRASYRAAAAAGPLGRCLVTGDLTPIVRTHAPLKGPPFPRTGAKLVAFDKDAFLSHNLEQGDNAQVSELAARKYTAALNALLERDPATARRRSAIDLDDNVVVFWTRDVSYAPAFVLDLFAPPGRGDDATRAAHSVWTGRASSTFDPTPFYGVTLGVNSARVVVRDWFDTTAAKVKEALERWFTDLHIGASTPEPVPLGELLRALEAMPDARDDKRGLPPSLGATLFRAAIQGGPLPRSLLTTALQRMRVPPNKKEAPFVLFARVAIIKAVLLRQRSAPMEVPVTLDDSNTQRAYLLGRLFAALERQQLDAAGKGHEPNATIRDRYYAAASSTPAAVFGRLLSLSMHHAAKTRKDRGVRAERAKEAIMSRLAAEPFPRTLSLEEQGLFAIGYYHQRAAFFQKREDSERGAPT